MKKASFEWDRCIARFTTFGCGFIVTDWFPALCSGGVIVYPSINGLQSMFSRKGEAIIGLINAPSP
jgi:hypothetical protein